MLRLLTYFLVCVCVPYPRYNGCKTHHISLYYLKQASQQRCSNYIDFSIEMTLLSIWTNYNWKKSNFWSPTQVYQQKCVCGHKQKYEILRKVRPPAPFISSRLTSKLKKIFRLKRFYVWRRFYVWKRILCFKKICVLYSVCYFGPGWPIIAKASSNWHRFCIGCVHRSSNPTVTQSHTCLNRFKEFNS